MRVATYARISTDEARQPFSLEAQADRLSAYVSTQPGWVLARSYTDQMTGKSLERPGLQRALSDARAGRYDLLLVFKVDRLARSTSGLLLLLEQLQAAGVAFRSASEPLDTSTAAGRMMLQMLGVFAEFEREMIVERTKMGLAKKAARGVERGAVAVRLLLRPRAPAPRSDRGGSHQRPPDLPALRRSALGNDGHQQVDERRGTPDEEAGPLDPEEGHRHPPKPHVPRPAAVQR